MGTELNDPGIQLDHLGDQHLDMTLEEVHLFIFVEAQESGKRSASRLLNRISAEAASNYSRTKTVANTQVTNSDRSETCSYCINLEGTWETRNAPN